MTTQSNENQDTHFSVKSILTTLVQSSSVLWGVMIGTFCFLIFLFAFQSAYFRQTELKLSLPVEFGLRSKINKEVPISEKLKILLFEDNTFSSLQRPNLYLEEWRDLISLIAKNGAQAILIDKIFGSIEDTSGQATEVFSELRSVKTPLFSGTFSSPFKIVGRPVLDLSPEIYNISKYVNPLDEQGLPHLQKLIGHHAYGGTQQHQEVMTAGHINYNGDFLVAPFIQISDEIVIPHISLLVSSQISMSSGNLSANDAIVPLNQSGFVIPNFLSPQQAYSPTRTKSVRSALKAVRDGRTYDFIEKDDIVLILPAAYTGNTDFAESPYGSMPAGFILAAMINSVVTGNWVHQEGYSWYYFLLVSILATAITFYRGSAAWVMIISVPLIFAGTGLFSFVYLSWHLPWVFYSFQSFSTSFLILAHRSRYELKRQLALAEAEAELIRSKRNERILVQEKKEAAEIAAAFIPQEIPKRFGALEVSGFHQCLDAASGDWYFFERSSCGRFFHFVLCDISGHGVQAALVVSTCKTVLSMIHEFQPELIDRSDFVLTYAEILNSILCSQGAARHTATLVGVGFRPDSEEISYLTCGHPFPLMFEASATESEKKKPRLLRMGVNSLLGVEPHAQFKLESTKFHVGDELVVYSDGIQTTGTNRIIANYISRRQRENLTPIDCVQMNREHHLKQHHQPLEDDVSLVFFQFKGSLE